MTWFSQGYEEAEKASATFSRRSKKRLWVKDGEVAIVRFLAPATDSLNYKRAYIPSAKGEKYYTSPGVYPDPFVQQGLTLQQAFAWKVIDRRLIEFTTDDGEKKTIGPRISYFADGRRTQKALLTFEQDIKDQLIAEKTITSSTDFSLTSFDVRIKKDKGAPWYFAAVKGGQPTSLTQEDQDLIEKYDFDLTRELEPLPSNEIQALLVGTPSPQEPEAEYAYGDDSATESESTFFKD